uniref:Multidrug resistance-associated protein 4-like n=1 Tax=Branchiostoma floridae TaxID=7739 RepID=C3ZF34_BRAFL|eukprot:XP_002593329.1 hypothetical protein BRAFLDRAFT_119583 [Branchiostoma floridae]
MDKKFTKPKPNPLEKAGPLSKLFFWWLNPLFKTGYKRTLQEDDMYNIMYEDSSQKQADDLEREWKKELDNAKESPNRPPSLKRALFRLFGARYLLLGLCALFVESVKIVQPIVLTWLLGYFAPESTVTTTQAYMYALIISVCAFTVSLCQHPYMYLQQAIGWKMRVACCGLVYRKALKLNHAALGKSNTGQIVNLMSNDVSKFDLVFQFSNYVWIAPLAIIVVTTLLYRDLGPPSLAGFGYIIFHLAISGRIGRLFATFRGQIAKKTDVRIRTMSEIISAMRVIKMYTWEKPFSEIVANLRKAVYHDAEIYLLDDPLSAVDSEVGRHLFNRCIQGVLSNKACILVTHQLQYLKEADQIMVLLEGEQVATGTYSELQNSGIDFTKLMGEEESEDVENGRSTVSAVLPGTLANGLAANSAKAEADEKDATSPLLKEEDRMSGTVGWRVYRDYFSAGAGVKGLLFCTLLRIGFAVLYAMSDWWLAYWLEIGIIIKASITRGLVLSLSSVSSRMLVFCTFVTFALTGHNITAGLVFRALGLYNILQLAVFTFLPIAIVNLSESLVSLGRIQEFLLLEEAECEEVSGRTGRITATSPKEAECSVMLTDVNATWTGDSDHPTLKDINLQLKPGQLLAVIGPVGSGKSSLLSAVLKELPVMSGEVKVHGKVGYASQQPWVFSGTVRQNILFGRPYKEDVYNEVIQVCALEKDLELLPHGDMTLVGDRGVTLSGGQKARINLARAVYHDAEIYLLDDPLSAVDSEVGRHLFNRCIQGVLSNKACILVTHQLQYLKEADQIMVLLEGEQVATGTYSELQNSGIDFTKLMGEEESEDVENGRSTVSAVLPGTLANGLAANSAKAEADEKDATSPLLKEEDRMSGTVGWRVYRDYFSAGAGVKGLLFCTLLRIGFAVLYAMSDWWLAYWAQREEQHLAAKHNWVLTSNGYNTTMFNASFVGDMVNATATPTNSSRVFPVAPLDTHFYIYILTAFTVGTLIVGVVGNQLFLLITVVSSKNLHNAMFNAIIRAPIRFFDTNPVGRVLNRFSKDIGQLDEMLPLVFSQFAEGGIGLFMIMTVCVIVNPWVLIPTLPILLLFVYIRKYYLSTSRDIKRLEGTRRVLNRFSKDIGQLDEMLPLVFSQFAEGGIGLSMIMTVCVIVNPWVLIPTLPILLLFMYIRKYYLSTSRDIKRLEGTTRSPMFSHLSATIQGLWTIRAFGAQESFQQEFDAHQDLHSEAWFLYLTCGKWMAIRVDVLVAFFVSAVAICSVPASNALDDGLVGLSVTYAIILTGRFQFIVRQSAELENLMTSAERVLTYTKLEPEAPLTTSTKPPRDWPQHGGIKLEDASFSYSEDGPDVLKNLCVEMQPQEKIGIVGRTGAGKSSLMQMLFRMAEPQGTVRIDGVDVTKIGLYDLRKKISVIPQDPVLFSGTLRRNLDPFNDFTDQQLWSAIEEVQLKQAVNDLQGKLESEMAESGTNFSVGQRQLVCLARALLRKNRILIIDEATANVDPRTDQLIQETIREKFKNCTVLTIAHRLNTVIDSDRILVLQEGRVQEMGEAHALLQDRDGVFTAMVDQSGKALAAELREAARQCYIEKHGTDQLSLYKYISSIVGRETRV